MDRRFFYFIKTEEELEIFETARSLLKSFGKQAIRYCIISHTETVSDLLEVLLLEKECGMMHGVLGDPDAAAALLVVPLFETIDMRSFYAVRGFSISYAGRATNKRSCSAIRTATMMAGFLPATESFVAPRRSLRDTSRSRNGSRSGFFTGTAEPSGVAAAQATKPFWRNHRKP